MGDPDRFRQIILNLVGNALKFTREGGVAIRLSACPDGVGAVRIKLDVEDTGVGMSPEDLERIFDRFVQVGDGASAGMSPLNCRSNSTIVKPDDIRSASMIVTWWSTNHDGNGSVAKVPASWVAYSSPSSPMRWTVTS